MHFPKKIDDGDMDLIMKEWKLTGLHVHVFRHPPLGCLKPNVWVSGNVDHPGKAVRIEDIDALYTHRGDHYLALHPYDVAETLFDGLPPIHR